MTILMRRTRRRVKSAVKRTKLLLQISLKGTLLHQLSWSTTKVYRPKMIRFFFQIKSSNLEKNDHLQATAFTSLTDKPANKSVPASAFTSHIIHQIPKDTKLIELKSVMFMYLNGPQPQDKFNSRIKPTIARSGVTTYAYDNV